MSSDRIRAFRDQLPPVPKEDILERFYDSLLARNKTPQTIRRYIYAVKSFINKMGLKESYTTEDVERYLASMRREEKKGTYMRFTYYTLKTFFTRMGWDWGFEKEDVPKLGEEYQPFYSYEEWQIMEKAASERSLRDWLLMRILWITGCRRGQAASIIWDDYDPKAGTLRIVGTKGTRTRTWPMDPKTLELLEKMKARPTLRKKRSSFVLGGIHANYVTELVTKYAKRVKIKPKGAHAFRRGRVTYESQVLDMKEKEIQEAHGWKTPTMPHRYIQLTPAEAHEKIQDRDPEFQEGK